MGYSTSERGKDADQVTTAGNKKKQSFAANLLCQ
jgi:hypothetical protein